MTALQTRTATEDEADRLALLRYRYEVLGGSGQVVYTCMTEPAADAYAAMHWSWTYRPIDKQGDVEPFDVDADWEEKL